MGQRSTAGSVRGYGAVSTRVSPSEQAPRVSKLGQRVSDAVELEDGDTELMGQRVLTTIPLQFAFFILVILEFCSLVLSLLLFLNTAMDLSPSILPYRRV